MFRLKVKMKSPNRKGMMMIPKKFLLDKMIMSLEINKIQIMSFEII